MILCFCVCVCARRDVLRVSAGGPWAWRCRGFSVAVCAPREPLTTYLPCV